MTRTFAILALTLALGTISSGAQQRAPRNEPGAASTSGAQVNLNTATLDQLESLPGIGRATAERIIEYREKSGGFKKAEELMNVRGVGEKSFLRLKALVMVAAQQPGKSGQ
jgi:competence protein ComEA